MKNLAKVCLFGVFMLLTSHWVVAQGFKKQLWVFAGASAQDSKKNIQKEVDKINKMFEGCQVFFEKDEVSLKFPQSKQSYLLEFEYRKEGKFLLLNFGSSSKQGDELKLLSTYGHLCYVQNENFVWELVEKSEGFVNPDAKKLIILNFKKQ